MVDFQNKLTPRTGKRLASAAIGLGVALAVTGEWLLHYRNAFEPLAWRLATISFLPICAGLCYHLKVRGYNPALPLLILIFPPEIWGAVHAPATSHSIGTDAFPLDCIFYLIFMSVAHFIIFILGCVVLFVISALSRRQCAFLKQRVGRYALFNLILLLVGCVFSSLWSCFIFGNFYWSYDSLGDFEPIWPITRSLIDYGGADIHGQLFGISLLELQLVWLAFAFGSWATTYYLYKAILRTYASRRLTSGEGPLTVPHFP
jgi:hypothetical protein